MRVQQKPPRSPVTMPRLWSIAQRSSRSRAEPARAEPRLRMHAHSCSSIEVGKATAVRALFLLLVLGALGAPAQAQSLEGIGYSGYLGEWELTATVTEKTSGWTREYSGPLTMRHIGLCTQDGPEERAGEMRL